MNGKRLDKSDELTRLSQALASRAAQSRASATMIRGGRALSSALLWQGDVAVTSAQSLPRQQSYEVVSGAAERQAAALAGIDAPTNVAVLRLTTAMPAQPLAGRVPSLGELALACGFDQRGNASVRLGMISALAGAWRSERGGRIDARIDLDIRLSPAEEGGPVFDSSGALLGMSTLGPNLRVMVIPAATLERIVPLLLTHGQDARGWLGIALHPVAAPEGFGQAAALMALSVADGGPAAKAGILAGDIVLGVDGQSTERFTDLISQLDADSIGRRLEMRVVRAGAVQVFPITIEVRPRG